jgi:hypothetical protein
MASREITRIRIAKTGMPIRKPVADYGHQRTEDQ